MALDLFILQLLESCHAVIIIFRYKYIIKPKPELGSLSDQKRSIPNAKEGLALEADQEWTTLLIIST